MNSEHNTQEHSGALQSSTTFQNLASTTAHTDYGTAILDKSRNNFIVTARRYNERQQCEILRLHEEKRVLLMNIAAELMNKDIAISLKQNTGLRKLVSIIPYAEECEPADEPISSDVDPGFSSHHGATNTMVKEMCEVQEILETVKTVGDIPQVSCDDNLQREPQEGIEMERSEDVQR